MEVFSIWFEKHFCKILKGHGSMLADFNFANCHIADIIIISLTPRDHLQKVFESFEEFKLKLHPCKCQFFHT